MSSDGVRVRAGETFDVALAEPVATGHRWHLTDAPEQIALVGERYEPPRPGAPIGGAGRRLATLRATAAGHYRLKFELARPWEDRPVDEHHVEVDAV